ncbi:MAG: hypothetical protein ACRCS3_01695 [Paracoccaceae bacterium]
MLRILILAILWPLAAIAKPATPVWVPPIADISFGIFCAIQTEGDAPAPLTRSGVIHTVANDPAFHWPGQRIVPASLGLAFGVKSQSIAGTSLPFSEMRVLRPNETIPDIWNSPISDIDPSFAFFRFDTEEELIPGIWVFEAWDAGKRLYRVEFQVVPADQGIGIASACGGTS